MTPSEADTPGFSRDGEAAIATANSTAPELSLRLLSGWVAALQAGGTRRL